MLKVEDQAIYTYSNDVIISNFSLLSNEFCRSCTLLCLMLTSSYEKLRCFVGHAWHWVVMWKFQTDELDLIGSLVEIRSLKKYIKGVIRQKEQKIGKEEPR